MAKVLRELAQETLEEEQTLTEITEHIAGTLIDSQIREVTSEELDRYTYQVEVANAIGQHVVDMNEGMVEIT